VLSDQCYAPPAAGAAQPAVADIWASPFDPGSAADLTAPIYSDACQPGGPGPPVDTTVTCVVPTLKKLLLVKPTNTVEKGRVIAQSVRAGKRLKGGSKIAVVVSRGRKRGSG
jgi:hypothetical protein